MNRLHHWYCNREAWKRRVREELVPPAIEGLELGDEVLEIGPGFGPASEVLTGRVRRLTALEIDTGLARSLRERLGDRAEIVDGDATAMPFPDASFDAAVCFTMLHHVPTVEAQDRLFAEVGRVLRPGGCSPGPTASEGASASRSFTSATRRTSSIPRRCPAGSRPPASSRWPCPRIATATGSARSPCSAAGCGRARFVAA